MLVFLPLFSLVLLAIIFHHGNQCWRSSALAAAVVCGVFLTITTELFSLFRLLKLGFVLSSWGLFSLGLVSVYSQIINSNKKNIGRFFKLQNLSPFLMLLLGGVAFITASIGLIALVAPPNTWDSMTYHMSRVAHWIQNQSVAHYPTYNLPQLFHPPFAEFVIMHLQILSGGDHFANFVQWLSMVGSIIGISLIAKELGADARGQVFAAVFCATIPMGILQGSSTQNDYVVGFWLVCLAYYVLLAIKVKNNQTSLLFIGASLGLAILTKSSAYFYAFPFMVWFGIVKLNRLRWKVWKSFFVVTIIFVLLNVNHYLRNFYLFGSIIGTPANFAVEYKIEGVSIPILLSNVLRNLSFHVDIIRNLNLQKLIPPLTGITAKILGIIHTIIGVDINDPRTTWPPGSYSVPGLSFDENSAGNPLHFFLILVLLFYCKKQKILRNQNYIVSYLLVISSAFLLFCLLLKIQPYQSRHHLSLFLLLSAFVGVVSSQISSYKIVNTIAVILIFTSLPWVFKNQFRPIAAEANIFNMTRNAQYFINRPWLEKPYVEAAQFVLKKECSNIGLSLGTGVTVGNRYWEYPFWILLPKKKNTLVRIEHINPQNISTAKYKRYPFNKSIPCAIISVRDRKINEEPIEKMVFKSVTYVPEWSVESGYISVLTKQ
jgi:4-amino-4-deoxy-L-arabinose transferase-like glycosyltransferase